jgi:transcriptional regulator with XRE-family HTH domain
MKAKRSRRIDHNSPLRVVRDALEMTQEKLADRLGVPRSMIENIERGRSSLDERLIFRLSALAGVVPESLRAGHPLGADGRPYDRQSYAIWKSMQWDEKTANDLIERAAGSVAEMLRAAVFEYPGAPGCQMLNEMLVELDEFVHSQVERRLLEARINAMLDAHSEPKTETLEMREIRKRLGDQWESLKKIAPALASAPATTLAIFTEHRKPLFSRSVIFPTTSGQPFVRLGTRDFKIDYTVTPDTKGAKTVRLTTFERDSLSPTAPTVPLMTDESAVSIKDFQLEPISAPPSALKQEPEPTPKTSRRAKA